MSQETVHAIILAAGKATRFNTGKTKLIEPICGQEMILYITKTLQQLHINSTAIIGYQKESVRSVIKREHATSISFIEQEEQKGTGHALMCSKTAWNADHILIINGDVPLITPAIIAQLLEKHSTSNAHISFVVAHNSDPLSSYGRVIKTDSSIEIIEAQDFTGDPHEHCCINAGIYLIKRTFLEQSINDLKANKKTDEFYLTDLVKIASDKNLAVETVSAPFDAVRGINNLQELWAAEQIKRSEIIRFWMEAGVRFRAAQNVHIDQAVTIGSGTYIGCGVHLFKNTHIGKNCTINEFSSLENVTVKNNSIVHSHCVIKDSYIGQYAQVGPFAHVKQKSTIEDHAVIGTFVEVKETVVGKHSKAKHLSYLGNTYINEKVNIGAGTITCNHDGTMKQKTYIQDGAYIGSNTILVAPITIGAHAFTAAGSVITKTVPANTLAFGRARQVNRVGYVSQMKENTKKDAFTFSGATKSRKKNHSDSL